MPNFRPSTSRSKPATYNDTGGNSDGSYQGVSPSGRIHPFPAKPSIISDERGDASYPTTIASLPHWSLCGRESQEPGSQTTFPSKIIPSKHQLAHLILNNIIKSSREKICHCRHHWNILMDNYHQTSLGTTEEHMMKSSRKKGTKRELEFFQQWTAGARATKHDIDNPSCGISFFE